MLLRDRHSARILDTDHGDWRNQAACKDHDPETFFPDPGSPAKHAKAICKTCEVTSECRALADRLGLDYGVFGGTTAKERRIEAARRRRQPGPNIRRCHWCRGMFMSNGAVYCGRSCREQAAHAMRAGSRQRAREETHA